MTTGVQISALPTAPVLSGAELVPIVSLGHISGITQATNAVITISDTTGVNPFSAGQQVYVAGVGGMTQINGLGAIVSAAGGSSGAWTITVPINSSAFSAYTSGGQITTTVNILLLSMRLSAGTYNPTFQSGNVQYAGPGGTIAGDNNMIFGKALPNPSGIPGPALLLGSGGGGGVAVTFAIIQDQAFDNVTPGNNLIVTSGETQPAGTQPGGSYQDFGGASFAGIGGLRSMQGGTSANAGGGQTVVKGGAATGATSAAIPNDTFIEGGDTGKQGANVHLIMTLLNALAGDVRIRVNSTILIQFLQNGEIYLTHSGTGAGLAGQPMVSGGVGAPANWLSTGFTGTVALAKLTSGGTNGSLAVASGIITAYTAPT